MSAAPAAVGRAPTVLGRLALAAMLLSLAACAARREEALAPEVQTKISGDGVVEADPDKVAKTIERSEHQDDATAPLGEADAGAIPDSSARESGPALAPEAGLRVVDVRRASDGRASRFAVQLSRPPADVKPFELQGPPRCVVDVDGPLASPVGPTALSTGDPLAPRLRVGQHEGRLRVVLDVTEQAPNCEVESDESALIVSVGNLENASAKSEVLWQAASLPLGAEQSAARALGVQQVASAKTSTPQKATPERVRDGGEADVAVASPPPAPRESVVLPPGPPIPSADDLRPQPRYTGERISLEFKDADILNVLRIIADVARRNIVATDDVQGRVTIALYDVPWDQALDILLKSTGLEMVSFDDVITISTSKRLEEERRARLAAQRAGEDLEPLQTTFIRVNYVKPRDLANILRGGDNASGGENGAPAEGGENQGGILTVRGSVQVDEVTSTLVVRDTADGVMAARELARRLDVQTPQVAIQGLIFEADTNMQRDLGIRWGARYIASPETGNPTGKNFPGRIGIGGNGPNDASSGSGSDGGDGGDGDSGGGASAGLPVLVDFPAAGIQPGSGSTLGILLGSLSGSTTIDAQLTALEAAGKGKIISRPKVITLNNAEAMIQSLEILRVRLPSTGTVINTGQGGVAGAQTVATQAIDTGITLRVTPQVSSDGYVLLQLFVKSSVPSNIKTDDIPNEISRQATSQVLVRDGETVVIGGVYRQRANIAEAGVPWLRSVPVFGWLFKNQSNVDNRQELLVFITPKVVWRNVRSGLPSARELWDSRDRSAYKILTPNGGASAPAATAQ